MILATDARRPVRRSGAETRSAIVTVATQEFRDHGYTVATLDDVADRLGITRSAVLHHFGTKAQVLHEVVRPWITALAELLDRHPAPPPLPRAQTRLLIGDLLDVLVRHRDVVRLLTHDISVTVAVSGTTSAQLTGRVVEILAGGATDPASLMRASGILGALSNINLRLGDRVDLTDPVQRRTAIDTVMKMAAR